MTNKTAYLLLSLIILIVYFNSFTGVFVVDDRETIVLNREISSFYHTWYNPVKFLNFLAYKIGKLNPFPYHFISIFLHILNTCLVYKFVKLFFNKTASFWGGLIFAIHPIHTEAVTWISGKPYLLLGAFVFISYFTYIYSTKYIKYHRSRKINWLYYNFSLILYYYGLTFNLGYLCGLPFLLILNDIYFEKAKFTWKLWVPFFILTIISIVLSAQTISDRLTSTIHALSNTSYLTSIINSIILFDDYRFWGIKAGFAILEGLKLIAFPLKLCIYHEPIYIILNNVSAEIFYSLFFLLLLTVFMYGKGIIKPLFFSLGFFLVFYLPNLSPIPLASLIGERYLYLPSVCFSIWIALFYQKAVTYKKYLIIFLIILTLLFSVRTIIRNNDFKSPLIFWVHEIKTNPKGFRALNNLGGIYKENKRYKEAIICYLHAIENNPYYEIGITNLRDTYQLIGKEIKTMHWLSKKRSWAIEFYE